MAIGQMMTVDEGEHRANPGIFADPTALSDEQWGRARTPTAESTAKAKASQGIDKA